MSRVRRGTVNVLLLRPVLAALEPPARAALCAAADLSEPILADADARVTAAQFCVAWAELIRWSKEPQIALRIAEATPTGAFGVVEYVCRSAPTLGDALRLWVRYLNLLDDAVEVGLVEEGDHAALRVVRESEAPAPASHELCFAIVVQVARRLSALPFRPAGVDFAHRAAGEVAVYRRWFDAPVRFGAEHTQLILARQALAAPLASADAALSAILTRHAETLAERDRGQPPLTAQVRRVLTDGLRADDSGIDQVSAKLGLTARSLQRRLKEEGTSFNELRESLRRELANRYLDDDLSISEIAFLLGFSEPSAFFRAFKRWTGQTPLEARRQLVPRSV
jgi:AraC-like DNA-binding protein